MTLRKPRKPSHHAAPGRQLAMMIAAKAIYPAWPADLVDLPTDPRARAGAIGWYDRLLKHRTPEAWQPSDAARVALLARSLAAWERELWLLQERQGGDAKLVDQLRAIVTTLSRSLGLSVAVRAPHLMANDAQVHGELVQAGAERDPDGDDLLARPPN